MYAEVKNGAIVTFPYNYDTLVKKNPYTKFGQTDLLSMYSGTEANQDGHNLVLVIEADAPSFDAKTQKVVKNTTPTLVNNVWTLDWSIETLTQSEQDAQNDAKAKSVRQQRTEKLTESDWTQVSDSPVDKAIWATYRQALRDITTQAGFPWSVTWPVAP